MAKYIAEINVMPNKALLDPQGKAVTHGLKNLGLANTANVRVGKRISIEIEAANESAAKETAEIACQKLLANPIMEFYEVEIHSEN